MKKPKAGKRVVLGQGYPVKGVLEDSTGYPLEGIALADSSGSAVDLKEFRSGKIRLIAELLSCLLLALPLQADVPRARRDQGTVAPKAVRAVSKTAPECKVHAKLWQRDGKRWMCTECFKTGEGQRP